MAAYVAGRSAGAARWPTRQDASGSSLIGMDETVVRTDRLTKRYGERLAVDSVSLTVGRGEVYGFLGPNGAGKTTTLSMITGLLRPDEGTVEIAGHDVWRDPVAVKSRIGVLPEGLRLFERLSGRELLTYNITLDKQETGTATAPTSLKSP